MWPTAKRKLYILCCLLLVLLLVMGALWTWIGEPAIEPAIAASLGQHGHEVLSFVLFWVGGRPVRVLFLIKCLVFFASLTLLSKIFSRIFQRVLGSDPHFDEHRIYVISKFFTLSIYVGGLLIGARIENISLHTFILVGGTLGVAVGLGMQRAVSNLTAGFFLLVNQPIRIGNFIEFEGRRGFVTQIGTSSSRLRTPDNGTLVLPNSDLVSKQVLNLSSPDKQIRLVLPVAVAYGTDPKAVMTVLTDLASAQTHILADPPPSVILTELGPSAMSFLLRVWTDVPADLSDELRSDLYVRILGSLAENKIATPFPQLDIHLRDNSANDDPQSRRPLTARTRQKERSLEAL